MGVKLDAHALQVLRDVPPQALFLGRFWDEPGIHA